MDVLGTQVGGDHYKNMKYQPIFVCNAIGRVYGFTGGNIAKYLCRYPYKGKPAEDLQKALHYINLHQALAYPEKDAPAIPLQDMAAHVEAFITDNKLPGYHAELLRMLVTALMSSNFSALIKRVKGEIETFPQCGDATTETPVSSAPPPMFDNAKVDLSTGATKERVCIPMNKFNRMAGAGGVTDHLKKVVDDISKKRDIAIEELAAAGCTNIMVSFDVSDDGIAVIKVWGTK